MNARMALRTAWADRPTVAPMAAGPAPSALARSTWQRRTVNPSAALSPRRRACRSAAVNARARMVGVMSSAYAERQHGKDGNLILH